MSRAATTDGSEVPWIRHERDLPVALVEKEWFCDRRLSLSAKGIMGCYACAQRGDQDVSIEELLEMVREDRPTVEAAVAELESAGYLLTGEAAEEERERRQAEQRAEYERWRAGPSKPRVDSRSVVYYLQRGDGAIKIGFSTNVRRRTDVLTRHHGPLTLLASEPGGWHRERERHAQFERLRIHRDQEWFQPGPALRRHIRSLANSMPLPSPS